MVSSNHRDRVWDALRRGVAIPAHPLALDVERKLDERRQRALSRYYVAAGAGGLAVGVHTTQFEIHLPGSGLLEPVLTLAAEEMDRADEKSREPMVRVAGICGNTQQAIQEAKTARELGYHIGLLSLRDLAKKSSANGNIEQWIDHCRAVAGVIDLCGFYLQPAAGGPHLPYAFWTQFCEIEAVRAIKIAPFNRYQTIDVIRAVVETGRDDIALYTGNDDNIVMDLLSPYRYTSGGKTIERRIVGGLLGHWAVWTKKAVELLGKCHEIVDSGQPISAEMLRLSVEVTDANAAVFDAANSFRGCIAGVHEILRRQGLLAGTWCLSDSERLSPSQAVELDRVTAAYPHLVDDVFVANHLEQWLSG